MPPRKRTRASVKRQPSSDSEVSVISIASSDFKPGSASSAASDAGSAYATTPSPPPQTRKRKARRPSKPKPPISADVGDIEDGPVILRPHGKSYHDVGGVAARQDALLEWFEGVRETRGMPWRKRYDGAASAEAKGQRAYEIWVSEVMLQQTQVATVIGYWERWMARWPTIAALADADIEDVNAAWRGLGYYRRARSLLEGARAVMANKAFDGRLPSDPDVLEKQIPGVGRYTAGAVASMAYGVRAPIVDGNVHRVLTRLLALHAPQTAPATVRFLWEAAEALVDALPRGLGKGLAGDWNQALMELGATVCRPTAPDCAACPLRSACHAFAELSAPPPDDGEPCDLCAPIPGEGDTIPSVTVFPMRKEKKASRVAHEVVCITEWAGAERRWLLMKRPERGLLAGLFEPPSVPVGPEADRHAAALAHLGALLGRCPSELGELAHADVAPVPHIFSHIDMTYHVQHLVIRGLEQPPTPDRGAWLSAEEVERANVGTGVKKVWAAAYGAWGRTERSNGVAPKAKPKIKAKAKAPPKRKAQEQPEAKVVRKVMMPIMPQK